MAFPALFNPGDELYASRWETQAVPAGMGPLQNVSLIKEITDDSHSGTCSPVLVAVSVSIGAFAATKSQNFTLYQDSQLNGAKLPAGEYKVVYDTDETNPQVKFLKGKKEIASATGQAKPLEKKPDGIRSY